VTLTLQDHPALLFAFSPVDLAASKAFAEDFERPQARRIASLSRLVSLLFEPYAQREG